MTNLQEIEVESYLSTGGITSIRCVQCTPEEASKLVNILTRVLHSHHNPALTCNPQDVENIIKTIEIQQLPLFNSNYVEDLPAKYLGYKRNNKTELHVRLREAWRILMNKPSIAYFTKEDGDMAHGMYKDAIRLTFTSQNIRMLSSQAFSCRLDQDKFTIPMVRCVMQYITYDYTTEEVALLAPFIL